MVRFSGSTSTAILLIVVAVCNNGCTQNGMFVGKPESIVNFFESESRINDALEGVTVSIGKNEIKCLYQVLWVIIVHTL